MNVKPLADRVVVKPVEAETKTSGGIIIPDNAKDKPQRGEVLAVGDGAYSGDTKRPVAVKVGEVVLYGKYSGTEIETDDGKLLILNESDILAVVE